MILQWSCKLGISTIPLLFILEMFKLRVRVSFAKLHVFLLLLLLLSYFREVVQERWFCCVQFLTASWGPWGHPEGTFSAFSWRSVQDNHRALQSLDLFRTPDRYEGLLDLTFVLLEHHWGEEAQTLLVLDCRVFRQENKMYWDVEITGGCWVTAIQLEFLMLPVGT